MDVGGARGSELGRRSCAAPVPALRPEAGGGRGGWDVGENGRDGLAGGATRTGSLVEGRFAHAADLEIEQISVFDAVA
jgi:hypothetical protein